MSRFARLALASAAGAADYPARGLREQAQDRKGGYRLPAAGLADYPEGLDFATVKADAIDGL
jgi:hypothetical protein